MLGSPRATRANSQIVHGHRQVPPSYIVHRQAPPATGRCQAPPSRAKRAIIAIVHRTSYLVHRHRQAPPPATGRRQVPPTSRAFVTTPDHGSRTSRPPPLRISAQRARTWQSRSRRINSSSRPHLRATRANLAARSAMNRRRDWSASPRNARELGNRTSYVVHRS